MQTQGNFILLWLFWTLRVLEVSLTCSLSLVRNGCWASRWLSLVTSLGDFGRKLRAIFVFIFTLILSSLCKFGSRGELPSPFIRKRAKECIFCHQRDFCPKTVRWAQDCDMAMGDSVVWSMVKIPFKCIQAKATECQQRELRGHHCGIST